MVISKRRIFFHLLAWLALYGFWVLVFQKRELAFSQTATVEFCYLIFIAANVYFNLQFSIPKFLQKKKYVLFVLLFFAGILCTALLRVPLALVLNKYVFIPGKPQPGVVLIFFNSLLNISLWVTAIMLVKLFLDRVSLQQHLDELQKQQKEAELRFLNAQFNPHFLFNSINSIYGQIDKNNVEARNTLLTFSDMLRYQLYECGEEQIVIDKELTYIRNYVALQKVRKNEKLDIKLDIAPDVTGFRISPLLFTGYIENCFKYTGSGSEPGDYIRIKFQKHENFLFFSCENSIGVDPPEDRNRKGIGLENVKRRLDLLYPGTHSLSVTETKERFKVTLNIPII